MPSHPATVFSTWERFSAAHLKTDKAQRLARRAWNAHVARNGNVPLVRRCVICSGDEHRRDVKHGRSKPARPCKAERDTGS